MAAELVEAMNMVKSFRVSELQMLLALMGRSKSGLKQDLVGRALRLVQKEHSPELLLHGADYLNGLAKPAAPTAADVKLAPLPFYQTLETLLPPTELVAQNTEKLQDCQCSFELTPSQVEQIRNCRELRPSLKSIQVVLRICYTDTSSIQEDQYPPNIAVKVNQIYCHVPVRSGTEPLVTTPPINRGVEPRRPCRPVNITPWMHLSTATNRITVTWGNFGKRYCVSLYLVRVFTAADLFTRLKHYSVESAERCRERIQDKLRFDPESEITTTGLCVSLNCPLVKMRLGVPCRALTCAHLQCFDAVFFLQMNEKKPTWTCPVCDKPAPFELLTIDGLLSEILPQTEDVEEIEFLADGSWRLIPEEKDRERSSSPQCTLLDISVVEANGHSPAHSGSSQSGATAPPAAAPAVVVDLTEDTLSEEEEGGGRAGDTDTETDDSQDCPPPKKGRCRYDKDLVTAY
ncbi:hypothetical protein COCON_G00087290 [Conger conger]|uniref:E3 SUMO-protein ligase PIAS4 n=1 Tax=Conger conger TaxID=82655 RepID=A0A9Q1DKE0_CONCO|nr:hypothetical protein COCON_G00087290 [Conger conger]